MTDSVQDSIDSIALGGGDLLARKDLSSFVKWESIPEDKPGGETFCRCTFSQVRAVPADFITIMVPIHISIERNPFNFASGPSTGTSSCCPGYKRTGGCGRTW